MVLVKNKILYLFNTEIQNFKIFIFINILQCYFVGNKNLNDKTINSTDNIII